MKIALFHFINILKTLLIILLLAILGSCLDEKDIGEKYVSMEEIRGDFMNPPDEMKPWTYYYWINNHISKRGISEDLEAMAEVGIGTALIANMYIPGQLEGDVEMLSEEWKELTRHAIREGGRLGIDIGLFNCPGFSASGGPWNDVSNSMRFLTYDIKEIQGGDSISVNFEHPNKDFKDVSLLAFRTREMKRYDHETFRVKSKPVLTGLGNLLDDNRGTILNITDLEEVDMIFESDSEVAMQGMKIFPSKSTFVMDVELLADIDGRWESVRAFKFDRSYDKTELGFFDYPPVVVSFPEIKSDRFKLAFKNIQATHNAKELGLADIIFSQEAFLEYYIEKSLAKMYQYPLPKSDAYMWPNQEEPDSKDFVLRSDEIIDLSENLLNDGTLNWKAPKGDWTIMRFGMLPTGIKNEMSAPNASGYEIDKLNKETVKNHFDGFVGNIMKPMSPNERKALKYVVVDSYEVGAQNWTPDFEILFEKTYGYDPNPYLPVFAGLIVNSVEESTRFLWDLRRMVADLVAQEYVAGMREICHENGLKLWLENYGHWGFPSEFLMYGGQSDLVAGEFWNKGELGSIECRAASSSAHIYGKNIVYAESYTTGGKAYSESPGSLKKRGDWSFAEGINHTVFHVFIQQPYHEREPGINAPFGTEINRKNTWFSVSKPWMDYLKRCHYLLQQGNYVADVAYFIGEDAPKMTGKTNPTLPKGYSFDYINSDVIMKRASVSDGQIVLPDGMSYRVLVLPDSETMRPELLQKIKSLVHEGAIVLGNPPKKSPSLENYGQADSMVRDMAMELWGNSYDGEAEQFNYGKGQVFRIKDLDSVFSQLDIGPDLVTPDNVQTLFVHRGMGDKEIYFITNQSDKKISFDASFRVQGMKPSLWNPINGKVRFLPEYDEQGNYTIIPIQLDLAESIFVVFDRVEGIQEKSNSKNYNRYTVVKDISEGWNLRINDGKLEDTFNVTLNLPQDLSKMDDENIKYYSGTMEYTKTFELEHLSKAESIVLDLGDVGVVANISLNGKEVGGLWTPPWKIDISNFVKLGTNELKVTVANLWMNQLIKDSSRKENEKRTWTLEDNRYSINDSLPTSGLIGPVTILKSKF